ncbi:MAG: NurA domain-containing protein [Gammaproteobacteria bacterium]
MGYGSKGRKPIERASKIAHVEIIKNPDVQAYVDQCVLPSAPNPESIDSLLTELHEVDTGDVSAVIAIDGGFTETYVREEYPSASIAFFTFGPLLFELTDLRMLDSKRFIAPGDLARLKNIERFTLVLPTKGVRRRDQPSLSATVRRTIYEFFMKSRGQDEEKLITSLKWFLFRRWKRNPDDGIEQLIERCPSGCGQAPIGFRFADPTERSCPGCGQAVYLTDAFRLHERIDEELGAGGISAYVMTMLEQLVLVNLFHSILERLKPSLMRNILFIKDGPLAFFGLVAPLYRPMRELVEYLLSEPGGPSGPTVRLAGLEKSGAFVEHAAAIQDRIMPGSFMVIGDPYIRRYIIPGEAGTTYGQNTYYGQKVLFRAPSGEMHVATIPAHTYMAEPKPTDIPHLEEILALIAELRCSMYDNALIPVALANKLVSLSDFPSQRILTTFARESVR